MPMPRIIYYAAASLDGYIAAADGGVGWLSPFEERGEDYGYSKFFRSLDALVMGSRTYEQALTFGEWPFENKACHVFSRRPLTPCRPSVVITSRPPREVAAELKSRKRKRVWLVGGGALAASFRAEGLITEYVISFIPVLLRGGIALFGPSGPMERLRLTGTKTYPNGVIQVRYVRADARP